MAQAHLSSPDMPRLLHGVSRSFYLSIRLLPRSLRRPIAVAYLLARATDTLADTPQVPAAQRSDALTALAAAIDGTAPAAQVADELARSFAPLQGDTLERNLVLALPQCLRLLEELGEEDRADTRAVLRQITRGQALDLERFGGNTQPRALETATQLHEYTYLVAGCVGEFWTALCFRHLPGFARLSEREMRVLGRAYGMGLQLVNILRDAGADLATGRCYFPADELAAAGLQPQDILRQPERFEPVRARWLDDAQCKLADGMRYADAVNSRRVRAASALPALLGTRTLTLLRAAGPRSLQHAVKVPRAEVRAILARLAFTIAARGPLKTQFALLHGMEADREWDNRAE